jgi:hypothetical protein
MSRPVLWHELKFSGNASTGNDIAYVPPLIAGSYKDFTVYVEFSGASTTGAVQIESAFPTALPTGAGYGVPYPLDSIGATDYTGTWAAQGSAITWATGASGTQKTASVVGPFALLRCRISTAVTSGTVRAFIVAASQAP